MTVSQPSQLRYLPHPPSHTQVQRCTNTFTHMQIYNDHITYFLALPHTYTQLRTQTCMHNTCVHMCRCATTASRISQPVLPQAPLSHIHACKPQHTVRVHTHTHGPNTSHLQVYNDRITDLLASATSGIPTTPGRGGGVYTPIATPSKIQPRDDKVRTYVWAHVVLCV